MPTFSPTTPTQPHEFQNLTIAVPYTFDAGHVLTAFEAAQLNRYVATAVGNAFGADLRRKLKAVDDARKALGKKYDGPMAKDGKSPAPATLADIGLTDADVQAIFNAKFAAYALGEGRVTAESTTPVDRLSRNLAGVAVKALIVAKGYKVRDMQTAKTADGTTTKFNKFVEDYIAANPWIIDQAKAQLASLATTQAVDVDIAA